MIVPAMEMPCKADNLALARERARHTQCQMCCLRPGDREPYFFGRRNQSLDKFAPLDLQGVTRSVVGAVTHLRGHRLDDAGMIVAENQRAVSAEVVHVFISIDVPLT